LRIYSSHSTGIRRKPEIFPFGSAELTRVIQPLPPAYTSPPGTHGNEYSPSGRPFFETGWFTEPGMFSFFKCRRKNPYISNRTRELNLFMIFRTVNVFAGTLFIFPAAKLSCVSIVCGKLYHAKK